MRVFITGVTGFLGSSLAQHLVANGHEIAGSSRTGSTMPWGTPIQLRLGQAVDDTAFVRTDAVVHAAHDLTPNSRRTNVDGTIAIAEAAARRGVRYQVFISSYSAHRDAVTEYGQTKAELQAYFLSAGFAVVQPGLVIGRGGLYSRIATFVRTHRVVPVVGPAALVPVIAEADLNISLTAMIERSVAGLARLYLDERVTMRQLMTEIRRAVRSRAVFVPVPLGLAHVALTALEAAGFQPTVSRDNSAALRANQHVSVAGDLTAYVRSPTGLAEMVDAAT